MIINIKYSYQKRYLICPICENTVEHYENARDIIKQDNICRNCGTPLVPLKGFYEDKNKK